MVLTLIQNVALVVMLATLVVVSAFALALLRSGYKLRH